MSVNAETNQVMDIRLLLEQSVRRYGSNTAIVSGDRRLSYAELDEASNKVANALIGMGIGKGDRVAMVVSNRPEFAIIYLGIAKAGSIAAPLDIRYKLDEVTALFTHCQPKVLVAESLALEPLAPALCRFSSIEHVIEVGAKYESQFLSYEKIIAESSSRRVEVGLEPDDTVHIGYTSGPIISPRGAMLSHRNLVTEAIISAEGYRQTERDVMMLFALPLTHMFGLVAVLLASIYRGSTVAIVSGTGLSIGTLMEVIEKEKGTMLFGVPYVFALAVSAAEAEGIKHDLSSLRLCISGGAPLSVNIIKQFKRLYGFPLGDMWGLTEATCQVTCPPMDGIWKIGSVGKALPGWEVKVVNSKGKELPPNRRGELIVRGVVMKGYYNNPQDTARAIKDGWLYTGDLGKIDEAGYVYIVGRKKKMIIVKGQNIYPTDIEAVLHTHPKVAEAAVVGIPDKLRGEIVRAVVSLKQGMVATEQEIRRYCSERMANYKVPKQIIFLASLPRTVAGKIRKGALKARLLASSLSAETVD